MAKGIHDEHRKRVRAEILKNGIGEGVPLHKILEYLLFYSIPRKDTNETAHNLKNRFGSLSGILEADAYELKEVDGIGDNTVVLFRLIAEITKRYYLEKGPSHKSFRNTNELFNHLKAKYMGYKKEMFSVLSFNSSGELLALDFLGAGDVASVGISARMVVEKAIKNNAVCIMIAHNHPSGNALPSKEDIRTTELISNAMKTVGIPLMDHIIICNDDYVSLAQSKMYSSLFN